MLETRAKPNLLRALRIFATVLALGFVGVERAAAAPLVRVTFADSKKKTRSVSGKVLVRAEDGGILLVSRDGILWNITPRQIRSQRKTRSAFKPFSPQELGKRLQTEFGADFKITTTKHYLLCSNAGQPYSRWCGSLFERLLTAFRTHWKSRTLKLRRPEFPLTAIIFATRKEFSRYAARDAGAAAAASSGYYSIRTNRVILYDLSAGENGRPARSTGEILRKIAASPFNVATIVHEATHQIAFNSGMHVRYADNPLWLSEGMAMYFETPDVKNPKGWRTIGRVNPFRIRRFRDYVAKRRQKNALSTLIADDRRFGNAATANDAYAEAWALTFFLIKTHRHDYRKYLRLIAAKPRLIWNTPQQRLQEFRQVFGKDLRKLDREFLRDMSRRRLR